MKRLIAKPRRNRKSIILTMKYRLTMHNIMDSEIKQIGSTFKQWMRDIFSNWDDSVLQSFMYGTGVMQNAAEDRLELEGHLDKIYNDEFGIPDNTILLTVKYCLDIYEDDPLEAKRIGKLFKSWMRDTFSQWNATILKYFVHDTQLDTEGYLSLEGHLDKILKDDCEHQEARSIEEDNLLHYNKDTSSSETTTEKQVKE